MSYQAVNTSGENSSDCYRWRRAVSKARILYVSSSVLCRRRWTGSVVARQCGQGRMDRQHTEGHPGHETIPYDAAMVFYPCPNPQSVQQQESTSGSLWTLGTMMCPWRSKDTSWRCFAGVLLPGLATRELGRACMGILCSSCSFVRNLRRL